MLTGRSRRLAKVTTCIVIAAGRTCPGIARPLSLSPRKIRTGPLRESSKVTISAVSAFSAAGLFLLRSREPPRTIFTTPHPVSGKVTSCTLPVLLSIACLTVSMEICGLAFEAASAVHAGAVTAQKNMLAQIPPRIAPSIGAGDQNHPPRRAYSSRNGLGFDRNYTACRRPAPCHRIQRSTSIVGEVKSRGGWHGKGSGDPRRGDEHARQGADRDLRSDDPARI